LPKEKQIPSDFFRKGDNVRGIIESVELKGISLKLCLELEKF
jgi:N utilization substance protein A